MSDAYTVRKVRIQVHRYDHDKLGAFTFNISSMWEEVWSKAGRLMDHVGDLGEPILAMKFTATQDLYEHVLNRGGVEEDHVQRVRLDLLPLLLVFFTDDGTTALIDGNHRLVKGYRAGVRDFASFVFTPKAWLPHLIGTPPKTIKRVTLAMADGKFQPQEAPQ